MESIEKSGKSLRIVCSISNEIEQDFQKYVRKRHALEDLMKDGEEDSDGRDDHLHDMSIRNMEPGMRHVKESKTTDDRGVEAESGNTIHLSDPSLNTMSSLAFMQGSGCQQPHKTEGLEGSRIGCQEAIVKEIAHGDCDPFARSPLSEPIRCSDSVSLRLRSSRSTTSFHLFAFHMNKSLWLCLPPNSASSAALAVTVKLVSVPANIFRNPWKTANRCADSKSGRRRRRKDDTSTTA
ncbi:hypothetical protein F3Y22_tig00116971pilonHSYRG00101 [Hibiscus syriacus]|uniref:Uncharacterized protein n=1 Tax=Hibiscus syriacus TaxID=106335 RepID=A0A6A2WTU6_HIBSY|nr:hypothetical protein F3Y22_tig00116971pilonHSYRG00101 [Hibiscus syriacus]